jgi:hypothetical protein
MEERPFWEKTPKPTPESIQSALGAAHQAYLNLLAIAATYHHAWNHSKQSGWMLKVHDKKKALLYLIPLQNSFHVSLTLRQQERDALLESSALASLHPALRSAKQYAEGYALAFMVTDDIATDLPLRALLEQVMAMRARRT